MDTAYLDQFSERDTGDLETELQAVRALFNEKNKELWKIVDQWHESARQWSTGYL